MAYKHTYIINGYINLYKWYSHIQDYPSIVSSQHNKNLWVPFLRDLLIQLPHEDLTTKERENGGPLSRLCLKHVGTPTMVIVSPLKSHKFEGYHRILHFQAHLYHIVGDVLSI